VLDVLENMGLVHKVLALSRYIRCHVVPTHDHPGHGGKTDCHHYLLCSNCRKVEEIEGENLENLSQKITKDYGFKIESHSLEFIGLCANCQKLKVPKK